MSIDVILDGEKTDLRSLPLGMSVAIFRGTFDPVHKAHVAIAETALEYKNEEDKVDLVLFYVHNQIPGKEPAPYTARVGILREILLRRVNIGILLENELLRVKPDQTERDWLGCFFETLKDYHPLTYSRLICERIEEAISANLNFPHLVCPRLEFKGELPNSFHLIPRGRISNVSSTDIREGKAVLGPEYETVRPLITEYYPRAVILA